MDATHQARSASADELTLLGRLVHMLARRRWWVIGRWIVLTRSWLCSAPRRIGVAYLDYRL